MKTAFFIVSDKPKSGRKKALKQLSFLPWGKTRQKSGKLPFL
jgi:hypothetical protein